MAVGRSGCGQQSESNDSIMDAIGRNWGNRDHGHHRQLLSGTLPGPGCTNFVQIGTTTGTTFNDTTAYGDLSYSYRVRAQDTANTLSPYSNVVSVRTHSDLSTSKSHGDAVSGTQIDLAWTAALKQAEPSQTMRCSAAWQMREPTPLDSLAQPASRPGNHSRQLRPLISDLGLTGGVFNYRVQAVDGSGNNSACFPTWRLHPLQTPCRPACQPTRGYRFAHRRPDRFKLDRLQRTMSG